MRLRLAGSTLLGLVGLTLLVACGGAPRAEIPKNAFSPYVALGDSFTSGALIPVQSQDGCFRSTHNYPSLIAVKLRIPEFDDRSCGGAVTADMTKSQRSGTAPQFDALSSGTRLVTIGVGGNDFEVAATLFTECRAVAASAPQGAPCRAAMQSHGKDRLLSRMPALKDRMARLLREIHQRSPKARVLVVGYPQSVPALGTCPKLLPIATGDYAYFREVVNAVNVALRSATREAKDTWIDVWSATEGHDICAPDPWINGAGSDSGTAAALHPLAAEQRAVADQIEAVLHPQAG